MCSAEVRDLIEQAASFERAGDPSEAVARARLAVARARDSESHDAATWSLARSQQAERRWCEEIEARKRRYDAREAMAAGIVEPPSPVTVPKNPRRARWQPRSWSWHRKLVRAAATAAALAWLSVARTAHAEPPEPSHRVTVEYAPTTIGLQLFQERGVVPLVRFEGGPRYWWIEQGYTPTYGLLCPGPCTTSIAPGTYRLALARDGDPPVPARETISIAGPSKLHASYVDHSGERLAGLLVGVGGSTVGALMAITAMRATDVLDQPLMVSGIGVALGSLIAGGALASVNDEAHVTVDPKMP
jgi:hypothetical protein